MISSSEDILSNVTAALDLTGITLRRDRNPGQGEGADAPLVTVSLEAVMMRRFYMELTVQAAIRDPLIELVNQADHIDNRAFAQLLESAARVLHPEATKFSSLPLPPERSQGLEGRHSDEEHRGCVLRGVE